MNLVVTKNTSIYKDCVVLIKIRLYSKIYYPYHSFLIVTIGIKTYGIYDDFFITKSKFNKIRFKIYDMYSMIIVFLVLC